MELAQLAMLLSAAASLALSLTVFVMVVRERGLRWKFVWALLALVGTGGAAMVWPAPDQLYWFFGVALPSASYVAVDGSWQPAMVRCLFPLGALIAIGRLYHHRRQTDHEMATVVAP